MKLFVVVACTLLAVASADVSHLSKKYLPPKDGHAHGDERVTTTIEKQELQELPEQIEYVDQPAYGQQEQQDHMAPVEHMMDAMMPSAEYLPPAMVRDALQQQQQEMEMEEPTTTMAADAMPSNEYLAPAPQDAPAAPLNQYLAPPPTEDQMAMMMEQQQPNYQQYQEELMRQQMMMMEMMQQEQQQQQMDEAVQPQAPIEPVAMEATMEPEPAHILANDGYHYKNADEARFRLRH